MIINHILQRPNINPLHLAEKNGRLQAAILAISMLCTPPE